MNALAQVAASRAALVEGMSPLVRTFTRPANRPAGLVIAALAAVVAMLTIPGSISAQAEGPDDPARAKAEESYADWGPEADGLRCRMVAVPPSTDEESPDLAKTTEQFARADEITFAVELKNVSDKPLTLLGVRPNTAFLAPHL